MDTAQRCSGAYPPEPHPKSGVRKGFSSLHRGAWLLVQHTGSRTGGPPQTKPHVCAHWRRVRRAGQEFLSFSRTAR